jgi:hypothetical protein
MIMIGATWWLRDMFIAIPILIGAICYISTIGILRVVPGEDFALLKQMAQGILRRIRRRETEPLGIGGV